MVSSRCRIGYISAVIKGLNTLFQGRNPFALLALPDSLFCSPKVIVQGKFADFYISIEL
jgi:hypothetical protein